MQQHDRVAVVDFGGQYAHLIATKVRRAGVLAEIRQPDDPVSAFAGYAGIILSGSPSLSSHDEDAGWTREVLDLDVPVLGFCFGHQEIAKYYGGTVIHGGREWGHAALFLHRTHPLFEGCDSVETVWMSHFDSVATLGPDFEELGYSTSGEGAVPHRNAAIGSDKLRRYGFQYHPEVDDTVNGDLMIRNFVLGICGCKATWDMSAYVEHEIAQIQAQVGDQSVFLLASGGVDSTVAAKLLGTALPKGRLKLLHVNNGLMRKDETPEVEAVFERLGLADCLHVVDATDDFLTAMEGLVEPEAKRHAIGRTFVEVFQREAARLGISDHLLGQGTIYPDTIESGATKRAHVIKTHHNRVSIIEELIAQGRVIEPLAELYKVEVRELAEKLGVPHDLAWRHPFPGPGLGVRLLCSDGRTTAPDVGPELNELVAKHGLIAHALPIKSVGVKADLRSYEHPVLLSGDAEHVDLMKLANDILKSVAGINRCVWNLGPAPTSLESRAAYTTRGRLDLLREADHQVTEGLRRHGLYDFIWQCPTAMVPLSMSGQGQELVVIRPVYSERAMTARPAPLPPELLDELREGILGLPGVSGLCLDLTSKPPGTIEWE